MLNLFFYPLFSIKFHKTRIFFLLSTRMCLLGTNCDMFQFTPSGTALQCLFFPHLSLKDQVSISPTFYAQLLCMQTPKASKIQSSHQWLFELLGSAFVNALSKMLVKSAPEPLSDNYPRHNGVELSLRSPVCHSI